MITCNLTCVNLQSMQILLESDKDRDITGDFMPNLIYVSRQKDSSSPHHFKAGALNALVNLSAEYFH